MIDLPMDGRCGQHGNYEIKGRLMHAINWNNGWNWEVDHALIVDEITLIDDFHHNGSYIIVIHCQKNMY